MALDLAGFDGVVVLGRDLGCGRHHRGTNRHRTGGRRHLDVLGGSHDPLSGPLRRQLRRPVPLKYTEYSGGGRPCVWHRIDPDRRFSTSAEHSPGRPMTKASACAILAVLVLSCTNTDSARTGQAPHRITTTVERARDDSVKVEGPTDSLTPQPAAQSVTSSESAASPRRSLAKATHRSAKRPSGEPQLLADVLDSLKGRPPILSPPGPLHPEAPKACRDPEESGCARCCLSSTSTLCRARLRAAAGAGETGAPASYGEPEESDGPCPGDCRPCARCTRYDEWRFASLTSLACDCRPGPVRDTGYMLRECRAYCGTLTGLLTRCPHLHPKRKGSDHK